MKLSLNFSAYRKELRMALFTFVQELTIYNSFCSVLLFVLLQRDK